MIFQNLRKMTDCSQLKWFLCPTNQSQLPEVWLNTWLFHGKRIWKVSSGWSDQTFLVTSSSSTNYNNYCLIATFVHSPWFNLMYGCITPLTNLLLRWWTLKVLYMYFRFVICTMYNIYILNQSGFKLYN